MMLSSMGVLRNGGVREERGRSGGGILVVPVKQHHGGPEGGQRSKECGEPAVQAKFGVQRHGNGNADKVDEGQRDQDVPAETHQLIEAKARKREAQPHENVNVGGNLEEEPERAVETVVHLFKRKMTERRRKR